MGSPVKPGMTVGPEPGMTVGSEPVMTEKVEKTRKNLECVTR